MAQRLLAPNPAISGKAAPSIAVQQPAAIFTLILGRSLSVTGLHPALTPLISPMGG